MHIPRKRLFWAVGLGHMTNDTFTSMGPVLLTFLSATILPMTNTQIGFVVSASQLVGSISQPLTGWMADRSGGRWLGSIGVSWTVGMLMLSLALAAATRQYWVMFVPFALHTLGSGAFHPVGAMYAAESDEDYAASNLSIFFLLGQSGLALGPALAGFLLDGATGGAEDAVSLAPIFALSLAAIPGVLAMFLAIPSALKRHQAEQEEDTGKAPTRRFVNGIPVKAFVILGLMVALRSLPQPGSVAFIPRLFEQKGWEPAQYGLITSFFWIASGIAGIVFGQLADRWDRRRIMTISMVLGAPAFFLLPGLDGIPAFVMAVAAGGLTGGSHSIIVVLAQELIPASRGLASGTILGFIFGTGALSSLVIGALSDAIELGPTFQVMAVVSVIAGLLALALPPRPAQTALLEEREAVPAQI